MTKPLLNKINKIKIDMINFFFDALDPSCNPFQVGIDIGNTFIECEDCEDQHSSFIIAIHIGYFSFGVYTT